MNGASLPAWIALPAALLLVTGGLMALIGAVGLLRLRSFAERMHPPTLGTTLGAGCVLVASMLVSTALASRPVVHEVLIGMLLTLGAPVTTLLLMRAARSRSPDA